MTDTTSPKSHSQDLAQYLCHSTTVISRTIIVVVTMTMCQVLFKAQEPRLEKQVGVRPLRALSATVEHRLDLENAKESQKDYSS